MTSAVTTTNTTAGQDPDHGSADVEPLTQTALVTAQGKTSIADIVVEKIAGMATREISGVYKLGGGAARAFGAIREKIPGQAQSMSQGVTVEVGERQAAVDDAPDVVLRRGLVQDRKARASSR